MSLRAIQQWGSHGSAWLPATGLVIAMLLGGCTSSPSGNVQVVDRNAVARTNSGHYVVQRGDSLYSIAFRYGWDWRELADLNGISAPYTIHPGQKIRFGRGQSSGTYAAERKPAPASSKATSSTAVVAAPANPAARTEKPSAAPAAVAPIPTPIPAANSPAGWTWPANGPLVGRFSSNGSLNKGIDIGGQLGQPVSAASDGAVVYAGNGLRGYGELIIIKHSDLYVSAYGHNRKLLVREGQQVKAGQTIAEMGSTGTDQVKLHFEIRQQGKPVDPLQYLPSR